MATVQELLTTAGVWLRVLWYGPNGCGKTSLAATCPMPLVLLSERQGLNTLRAMGPEIQVILVETFADMSRVRAALAKGSAVTLDNGQPAWRIRWPEGKKAKEITFQTLVVDTATDQQDLMIQHIVSQRRTASAGGGGGRKAGGDDMRKSDWGTLAKLGRVWFRTLTREIDCHVVVLALDKVDQYTDEAGEPRIRAIRPWLDGQVGKSIGAYFNAVGYMSKRRGPNGQPERVVVYDSTTPHVCKGAPGWPRIAPNRTVGRDGAPASGDITLGSLALYDARGTDYPVAHGPLDSADYVERALTAQDKASKTNTEDDHGNE